MYTYTFRFLGSLMASVVFVLAPAPSQAQVEVEVDPFAYALSGFSMHVGSQFGSTRLSAGTFGIDIPEFFHENQGWTSRMRGGGLKWDYVGRSTSGWFAGLDAGYMRMRYVLESTGETESRNVIGAGIRMGYALPLGHSGFYVSPWMSVSHHFDGPAVDLGGQTFHRSSVVLFPTVHLGWRF